MTERPSAAELAMTDAGIWVRVIIGTPLLAAGLLLLQRGELYGMLTFAAVAWFALEIVRKVMLLRILGARGVFAQGLLARQSEPEGDSDWWSGIYEFEFGGRRYEHRVSSLMFSPRSSHGTVVGILFDPVDPSRAVVRGRFDQAS
jgi:hypothetical protein